MIPARQLLQRPWLSLLMCAAGAIVGLAIAGASLFSSRDASTFAVPPDAVATVNGKPVLRSDYVAQAETELGVPFSKATPAQQAQVLDEMIREELFVQRGVELGEQQVDPAVRAAYVLSVQQQAAVDAAAETPTEAKLRDFYAANRGRYESVGEMTVRDLVPAGAAPDMARAAAALRGGAAIGAVKSAFGLKDSGKVDGTELYFAAELHLGKALYGEALKLEAGQVAGPVMDAGAPHILVMVKNKRPAAESFEDARDDVYNDYRAALDERLRDSEYRFLRSRATIRMAGRNP